MKYRLQRVCLFIAGFSVPIMLCLFSGGIGFNIGWDRGAEDGITHSVVQFKKWCTEGCIITIKGEKYKCVTTDEKVGDNMLWLMEDK